MPKTAPGEEALAPRKQLEEWLVTLVGEGEIPRLGEALTHPSFANELRVEDNQRLELLGDAVLGLCVTETLLEAHERAAEGELTRMRSALVNSEALAGWARRVGLGECLSMGRGARAATEKDQTNVLADAVEALIAAVYLAKGIAAARLLVTEVTRDLVVEARALGSLDPKSELQEVVQAEGSGAPKYRVIGSSGPPHDPRFEVEVVVGETVIATGSGRSKRLAERAAAEAALAARAGGEQAPSPPSWPPSEAGGGVSGAH